jgi:hypothetical protein
VAGYNVSKLLVGSYGTLGLITEATLKLYPLPRARRSLVAIVPNLEQGLCWGYEALRHAITCSGIVLASDQIDGSGTAVWRLVYTAEGHPLDVAAELRCISRALVKCGAIVPEETDQTSATQLWEKQFISSDCVIRAAVTPAELAQMLATLSSCEQSFVMDVSNGMLALACPPGSYGELLSRIRSAAEPQGYAIMAAGSRSLLQQSDPWGKPRSTHRLMGDLKLRWDPSDILNRGEFISPLFPSNHPQIQE